MTQKGLTAGVIVDRIPSRTTVLLQSQGREAWSNDRIFWISDARAPLHSPTAAADAVAAFFERVEEARATIDLAMLWELLVDQRGKVSVGELADLAFSDPPPEELAAMACALASDDAYFHATGDELFHFVF